MLDKVYSRLAQQAREKQHCLKIQIEECLANQPLLGDPQRIAELLFNLADKAIKLTEQGQILLAANILADQADTLCIRFELQAPGIGIMAADQPRVRQDLAYTDLMGGQMGMESRPGQGRCFWLKLSLAKGRGFVLGAPRPQHAARDRLAAFSGRRLLLAEDNIVNQEVAIALLGSAGLAVDVACDGQAALDMMSAPHTDYALLLMDVQMPVMDGLDATRAIRRLPRGRHIPILAMTANAFAEERQRCLDAGMNDHVAKPVVAEQLFNTLHLWLSHSQNQAGLR